MFKQTALLRWKQPPKFLASCSCTDRPVSKETSYLNDQQRDKKYLTSANYSSFCSYFSVFSKRLLSPAKIAEVKKKQTNKYLIFSEFALLSSYRRLLWKKHPSFLYCWGQHMRVPLPVLQGLSFLRAYLHCHESSGNHLSFAVSPIPDHTYNSPLKQIHF